MLRLFTIAAFTVLSASVASAQQIENCGSYQRNGPILTATCIGNYGVPQQTSIDLRSCPMYAVRNQSGALVCGGGGGYGGGYGQDDDYGPPPGYGPPGAYYGRPRYGY